MRCKAVRSWVPVAFVVGALALAACGSDESGAATSAAVTTAAAPASTGAPTTAAPTTSGTGAATTAATPGSAPANGFAPVTISHQYGSTTVDERPERIVSLDTQWTDVLLALDEMPIGYLADPYAPGGFPWRGDMLATSTQIEAGNTLPFEQIAALQPDLIVVSYLATDAGIYQKLSGIAPTITTLTDAVVDPWPDIAAAAGQLLGEQEAATTLTDSVEADIAAVAEAIPGLDGKTFTFFNIVVGDGIYVLTDPDDGANQLFSELGLVVAPAVAALGTDVEGGRVQISFEQTDLLDADLMVYLGNGADVPTVIAGFDDFPAVQAGAAAGLSYEDIVGLNTPSPLSIPYALEKIRPALEAAAG